MQNLIGKYVIVRSVNAGVHAGTLSSVADGGETLVLTRSRRLWRWWAKKSISLSGVARHGLAQKSDVRIGGEIETIAIRGWCEVIEVRDEARDSISTYEEAQQES